MGQPLDLRKAFFYGQFVQAAYTMFRNPQGGDALRPEPVGIPEGWELGAWIHRSDFILSLKEPEFCASSSITCKIRTRGSLHSGHRGRYGVDR
jgi:hypothetical protein